jgi:hypothetical protein
VDHIDKSMFELDKTESWLSLYGAELNVSWERLMDNGILTFYLEHG